MLGDLDMADSVDHITWLPDRSSPLLLAVVAVLLTYMSVWLFRIGTFMHKVGKQRTFMKANFPHYPTEFFFGHMRMVPKPVGKVITEFIIKNVSTFPRKYCFFFGPVRQNLALVHPETVKVVLRTSEPKNMSNFGPYRFLQDWLGNGLLISSGKQWFRNRRLLTPAFHFDVLRPYMSIYSRAANTLADKLTMCSNNGMSSVEIYNPVSLCTLEIMLKCAFSFEEDVQQIGENHPYVTNVINISKQLVGRVLSLYLYPDLMFYSSPSGRSFTKSRDFVWKIAHDIIAKRRKVLDQGKRESDRVSKRYKDFLDILLLARDEEGNGLTEEEIRQEVDTFLFEGHDTTASAISWCLHALAENSKAQALAREEIDAILKDKTVKELEWDDLQQLPYLTMCIKESLRRTPPVPLIMRELTQPIELDGVTLPKDLNIGISVYGLHHNRSVWGDDHRGCVQLWRTEEMFVSVRRAILGGKPITAMVIMVFAANLFSVRQKLNATLFGRENSIEYFSAPEYKPERFSPENMKDRDSHAFIGFSAGPRNCIGQNFAMHELKVIIAKMLYRFELSLDPNHEAEVSFELVLRSNDGIKLFLKTRHH